MHVVHWADAKNVGYCIATISLGIFIAAFLDNVVRLVFYGIADCFFCCTRKHGGKCSRVLWQTFHAIFHTIHMLILFLSMWYAIRFVLSEETATNIFAGVGVGIGFAMQDVVKAVLAFFRISLSGEIVEGCLLNINGTAYGTVKSIAIFHVCLEDRAKPGQLQYISTTKLIDATYTVGKAGNRCGDSCSTEITTGPHIGLFNHRLVR